MTKRRALIGRRAVLAGASALSATGCWGSFNLTGKVYDWNGHFDSKWVSWLVFLAFIILPVYSILLFVDALIINTIEFYSGKNPVQRSADLGRGNKLVLTPTDEPEIVHVEITRRERVVRSFYIQKIGDEHFRLLDERGAQLALARSEADGVATLRDQHDREVGHLTSAQQARIVDAARRRESVGDVLLDELGQNGEVERVLALASDIPRPGVLI